MSFVVGTAGHIDHGKSTLITALTGIDPDRLAEEKRRGMTIDLGFAHMTLPSGREIGIVDVPGHARFMRNMLAGAHGIDLVLSGKNAGAEIGWLEAPANSRDLSAWNWHSLTKAGWSKDKLKVGQMVTLQGWQAKNGTHFASAEEVTMANGEKLSAASSYDRGAAVPTSGTTTPKPVY